MKQAEVNKIVATISDRICDDPDLSKFCIDHADELVGEIPSGEDKTPQWWAVYNEAMTNILCRVAAGMIVPHL